MKQILLITLLITTVLSSCKKDSVKTDNNVKTTEQIIKNFVMPSGINDEAKRIINDVTEPDYTIAITDNPNYGKFSSTPWADIMLAGKSPSDIIIKLDGNTYTPVNDDGMWFVQSADLKQYYGKNVEINIKDSDSSYNFNLYIPKPVLVNQLSPAQSQVITKSDNVLTWDIDENNTSDKVAFFYELYDNEDVSSSVAPYKRDILLLDNNGNYNIDNLIDNNCKRIFFRMITGNTASFINKDGKKILFYIASFDHHEYIVK